MGRYEYNDVNKARIMLVAERLNGTCLSVDSALEDEFGEDAQITDFAQDLLEALDDQVTLCECCGYWCETSLCIDEVCDDCVVGED